MIDSKFNIKAVDVLLEERGLNQMGRVQMFIDAEVIKLMKPYTPALQGVLSQDAVIQGTTIGSGRIRYSSPYARFQYYGKVMIYEPTGSTWAPRGASKTTTEEDLKYNTHMHSMAGKLWFERMKADKKEQILAGAKKVAGAS